MARTVAQIQAQIIQSIAANSNLNYTDDNGIVRNITYNTSNRAIWRNITFIVAAAIAVFEQLQDLFLAAVEAQVAQSAAASSLWVQAKMFAFQYDANNPQVNPVINMYVDPSNITYTATTDGETVISFPSLQGTSVISITKEIKQLLPAEYVFDPKAGTITLVGSSMAAGESMFVLSKKTITV